MLVPAVCYKDEILKKFDKLRYSDKIMYYNGCIEDGNTYIYDGSQDSIGRMQYAIVHKYDRTILSDSYEKVVGYLSYTIDYYSSTAYNFGLISFEDHYARRTKFDAYGLIEETLAYPNWDITNAILQTIKDLQKQGIHRIEFCAVSGNPACEKYDKIIKRFNTGAWSARKIVCLDTFRDRKGIYHSTYRYEIIRWNCITEKIAKLREVNDYEQPFKINFGRTK